MRHLWAVVGCVAIPAAVVAGALAFGDRQYAAVSLCVAVLALVPVLAAGRQPAATIEDGRGALHRRVRRLVLVGVLAALSAVGRMVFAPVPGFKPVTAFAVLSGVALGPEAGYFVGALSALLSNFAFGQGPWTPFQMAAWGILGGVAGVIPLLKRSRPLLLTYGALSGVAFSAIMDVWVVLWAEGRFVWSRFLAAGLSALPFTGLYAVSNVIFLWLLQKPLCNILERLKTKYGI